MRSYVRGGVLAGIIVFVWSAISWMVLPWHTASLHGFMREKVVSNTIVNNAPQSGIYIIPIDSMISSPEQLTMLQPFIFASVHLEGMSSSMMGAMVIGLLCQIFVAILLGWMLSHTSGLKYWSRVIFVLTFALAAAIAVDVPYWNWFAFDPMYTLVVMGDLIIGWFFGGLVIARFVGKKQHH